MCGGCNQRRRAQGATSAQLHGRPITPQEAAANAIANAQGVAYADHQEKDSNDAGKKDKSE